MFTVRRDGRNVVHDLLDGDIAVTVVAPRPRSGTLELHYAAEADAEDCARIHTASVMTFIADGLDHADMTYVIADGGGIEVTRRPTGQWIVTVDFQEVVS